MTVSTPTRSNTACSHYMDVGVVCNIPQMDTSMWTAVFYAMPATYAINLLDSLNAAFGIPAEYFTIVSKTGAVFEGSPTQRIEITLQPNIVTPPSVFFTSILSMSSVGQLQLLNVFGFEIGSNTATVIPSDVSIFLVNVSLSAIGVFNSSAFSESLRTVLGCSSQTLVQVSRGVQKSLSVASAAIWFEGADASNCVELFSLRTIAQSSALGILSSSVMLPGSNSPSNKSLIIGLSVSLPLAALVAIAIVLLLRRPSSRARMESLTDEMKNVPLQSASESSSGTATPIGNAL